MPMNSTNRSLKVLSVLAMVFGALTVFSGGRALFGGTEAQAAVGQAVGFVLWFNFLTGFGCVATGLALWLCASVARLALGRDRSRAARGFHRGDRGRIRLACGAGRCV